jgi:hypothetical protein
MWCDFGVMACYCLWIWWNKEIHEQNFIRPINHVQHIFELSNDYNKVVCANKVAEQRTRVIADTLVENTAEWKLLFFLSFSCIVLILVSMWSLYCFFL